MLETWKEGNLVFERLRNAKLVPQAPQILLTSEFFQRKHGNLLDNLQNGVETTQVSLFMSE